MAYRYREQSRKLVLLGNTSVGKTSILLRYTQNEFMETLNPTVGASFATKRLPQTDGAVVKLDIWDTAGQERYRSLTPMYYKDAAVAVVVFDVTSIDSFLGAKDWVEEVKTYTSQDVILVLMANKIDLPGRKVRFDTASAYAAGSNLAYHEMSAKTGENVVEAFAELSKQLYTVQKTPRSSVILKAKQQPPVSESCCSYP